MGKYEPLARYLASLNRESWDAKFDDIERVLGFYLPDSAYSYPAWWANQDGHHSQTKGWRDVGWETRNVNLPAKRVRFVRRNQNRPEGTPRAHPNRDISERVNVDRLIATAKDLSGIEDDDALLAAALTQFIQSEAAKGLIALGGSDPNAKAPPRRRFW